MSDSGWNFGAVWHAVARRFPDERALVHGDDVTSWADFDRQASNVASFLREDGVKRGATVALCLRNAPAYMELLHACFLASFSPVNTNYRYGPAELTYLWSDADVEAVVFAHEFAEVCDQVRAKLDPKVRWLHIGDPAICPPWASGYEAAAERASTTTWDPSGDDIFLMYTGGTTGKPKGVMWRQDDLFRALETLNGRDVSGPADVERYVDEIPKPGPAVLPGAPLMHGTACWFAMPALNRGGAVVTLQNPHFDAVELFDAVVDQRVKGVCIVGDAFATPMGRLLEAEPDRWDLTGVRVLFSSGVMFSQDRKDQLLEHFPNATLVDSLGSSESGAMARSVTTRGGTEETASFRLGPLTRVIDDEGRDVPVGGTGRVATTGHIPIGYLGDPVKTAETFITIGDTRYVVTGDWAEVGADGDIRLLGRGSGCINTGGEKVFPEEVEEALKTSTDVSDAAVVGLPDDRFGSAIVALVEPVAGTAVDPGALIAHVKDQLAGYKAPRMVFAVDSVGRAPNGKLDYRALTAKAEELRTDASG